MTHTHKIVSDILTGGKENVAKCLEKDGKCKHLGSSEYLGFQIVRISQCMFS